MNDTEESSDDEYYNWTSIPEYNAAILVSKYNFVRKREVLTSLYWQALFGLSLFFVAVALLVLTVCCVLDLRDRAKVFSNISIAYLNNIKFRN